MTTALGTVPAYEHTHLGHPENPTRIEAINGVLAASGVLDDLVLVDPVPSSLKQLRQVHDAAMIEQVRLISSYGGGFLDADTYASPASFDQALLAAGTTCAVTDLILDQSVNNGLALVRPPGHHAEVTRVGGFCLFNNIAVAARHAQAQYDLGRIAIVDIDVHHGNGTQNIFYDDPSVLFISLHLYQTFFYPGTGSMDEIGDGPGTGKTMNIPMPQGSGDLNYPLFIRELVEPKIIDFKPELLLISVGFDAHWRDPLASMSLSLVGYAKIVQRLIDLAKLVCNSRIVFVLEGGYQLQALSHGVLNLVNALQNRDDFSDPLGLIDIDEPDVTFLLKQLRLKHLPS